MCGPSPRVSEALPLETIACPLCGETRFQPLFAQGDLALGVPGRFHVARCPACGLVYQNPRVRGDRLADCYPPNYAPHIREPELSRALRDRGPAVRRVLSRRLGYRHLAGADAPWKDRLGSLLGRGRIVKAFPPWIGEGRLLDVGCGSGKFLRQMGEVGWQCAGIEFDAEAAAKAREVTRRIFVGDPTEADFPPQSFDVITAFHVIEHLPDPLGAMRNMMWWLAPGGLVIVEVPNVGGWGGRLFGRYWSGLDFPRHLIHFTPVTMRALVERVGARIVRAEHKSKPRYLIRSLRFRLRNGGKLRAGEGILKLVLELVLPLAEATGRGEAVRFFIRRRGEPSAWYDAP